MDPRPQNPNTRPVPHANTFDDLPGRRERQQLEIRIAEAGDRICRLYPYANQLVALKLPNGHIFYTGFQAAVAALVNGGATLVEPHV